MCMGREIRQDTHVIVEMIFSLGGYHSSPRDAHAHKIDHIFARSAPRVPHRTAPNEMPKLLCMQNSRLFPQAHDTQHGAVQHVPFRSNATRDQPYITSAYICPFSDPPTQYVSINTVMNINKNCIFLNPLTQSFRWRNIGMVPYLCFGQILDNYLNINLDLLMKNNSQTYI